MTQCARQYTKELVTALNMAMHADKGFLPMSGGLLDQSAWFLDLWTALTNEQNAIDAERIERG